MRHSLAPTYLLVFLPGLLLLACPGASSEGDAYLHDARAIAQGNQIFDNNCVACHNFQSSGIGPNLSGVTQRVSQKWLKSFIQNPLEMIESGDERAVALAGQYKQYMPGFQMLEESEIEALLAYLHTRKARPELPTRTDWGEPVTDPIPEKIPLSTLTLTLREFAQVPPSATSGQQARINKMEALPDGSKRLFVHDLRGKLYELTNGTPSLFLDLAAIKPAFIHIPGHGTGMGSFAFHPEYAQNGLFYTTHTEDPAQSPAADFAYEDSLPVKVRWVLTEWQQYRPGSDTFTGAQRELMRINMVSQIHGVQEIAFHPYARPGDEDYGLLYIGVGDGGAAGLRLPFLLQDNKRIWGTLLRIDPLGNNSRNGRYGIPSANPYAGQGGDALGEIYAMGFRNPHRFSWNPANGQMLATCIGQHMLEELNLVVKGANYGWPEREGTLRMDKAGDLGRLYPLPADDSLYGFTYPAAQFDHDEALAISGGFVYAGAAVPALKGKYVFGGIVGGRLFMLNAATLQPGSLAPIQEIALELENGQPAAWPELTGNLHTGHNRVDLRIGMDAEGELYLMTKANGKIFRVIRGRVNNGYAFVNSGIPAAKRDAYFR